ncbi:hypothetical protein [Egicoccus sp. AB-alg2]|uniref:hypothetical protein n=1 Tax=Egicoccus sp. AB-alg2 TaxID=3242693 RepID=UPI00359D01B2
MTTPLDWHDHETWLADLLGPLDGDERPAALLACFTNGAADLIVRSRHERPGDDIDPLTELAVIAGERAPDGLVVALPGRVSDLHEPGRPTVAVTWILTSALRRGAGSELRVRQLPVGGLGVASDLDVEMSPVASVLDDAARHRLDEDALHVVYTAWRWGHTVHAHDVDALTRDQPLSAALEAASGRAAEAARHRLQRHARDLAARHRPLGGWDRVFERPAVHADTPDGWVPACPL